MIKCTRTLSSADLGKAGLAGPRRTAKFARCDTQSANLRTAFHGLCQDLKTREREAHRLRCRHCAVASSRTSGSHLQFVYRV